MAIIQLGQAFQNFFTGRAKYPKFRKKGAHPIHHIYLKLKTKARWVLIWVCWRWQRSQPEKQSVAPGPTGRCWVACAGFHAVCR
ncbi:hypothetical protein MTP29_11220, partial [Xylella fastidiosa subsp. multiplex]|uniref:hypothetical protein n=1 Tax=Xylella fastidiosa TaxID=2371 RepID=UPI0020C5100C